MAFKATLLHTLELAVVLVGSYLVLKFYGVDSDAVQIVVGIALGALTKFSRASDAVPMKDYVNE